MSSCFGSRKSRRNEDTDPLLPRYEDDTTLQRRVHQKLHSYQMLRALSKLYMPSNEQIIINLRTLLASDVVNANNPDLSDSGRLLMKYTKRWLSEFIELLKNKNDADQIQDFIWFLSKAKVTVDTEDIARSAQSVKVKADVSAAYESFRTVGSLLLTNSDFRIFLSDISIIGRQVFADTAATVSSVAQEASKQIEPTKEETERVKEPGADAGEAPTSGDLNGEVTAVSQAVTNGAVKAGQEAASSLTDNVSGQQRETLLYRLKQAVTKLRKRNDYSDSVSTIALLLKRYAKVYSRAADEVVGTAQEDVDTNPELDRAIKNFWSLLSSFGDGDEWKSLERKFNAVMKHSQSDPDFEGLVNDIANALQKLLTDPDFFDSMGTKIDELRQKSKEIGKESSVRQDVDDLLVQFKKTFESVINDTDVSKLIATSRKLMELLSPDNATVNEELISDSFKVFVPLLIQAVQYIPIPRLEISVPEIDLLLENLILEPGLTVNNTSFLPFRLRVETKNDLEIRKAKFRTVSAVTSLVTIKIDGLSIRADDVGFWLRAHSGIFRLADEGIASFELDDRGIDIHLDVEVGKDRLEKILTLRAVRVHIHHLNYTLRKSKFACLAWVLKPILRPIIRKVMERQLAGAIADSLHAANRELLFARERLRATRISDPQDIRTFVKAIITRLTPEEDPDLYTSVGVAPSGKGIFAGVYAPGSVVKLWNEEATRAGEIVEDSAARGWRNEIFDVQTTMMGQ